MKRESERGNSMVLAMMVLSGLGALSALTALSVRGGVARSGNDRFHDMAVDAAESGAAAAMDFLRKNVDSTNGWKAFVTANNASPMSPSGIAGNNVQPSVSGNVFDSDVSSWYSVQILNNKNDPGFATGLDQDKRVIIRSTGYGPDGAVATIEWEISATNITGSGRPCPAYGQKGMAEDGAGRNDCLGTINAGDTATYRPGG